MIRSAVQRVAKQERTRIHLPKDYPELGFLFLRTFFNTLEGLNVPRLIEYNESYEFSFDQWH